MDKKHGLYTVFSAIAIQLTLGVAYIWSVFQTGVADSIFNGDNAAAGLTFSLLLAMLAVGSAIGGKLAARHTTRRVVFAGGVILSAGFLLASFATKDCPWLLWTTYGVMGGVGMGFTYSTTIACAQKWYPRKKGLVTGIIVSALGFGGVIFTPAVESLISRFGGAGVGEPRTFVVLGGVFFVVCTVGSISMKNPPDGYLGSAGGDAPTSSAAAAPAAGADGHTPSQMLRTLRFYVATATYLLACMGGLMMIGFAKPIAVSRGLGATATVGVLAVSMFNSLGRLLWGMASDRLGRKNTIIVLLAGSATLSLMVNAAAGYWIYVLIALIGFFYGGIIGTFPSLTSDLFGARNMAANYGFVLLGFGAGAVISSQIAGYYKNVAADNIDLMFPAFVIASCCAAVGIALMLALKAMDRRRAPMRGVSASETANGSSR